MTKRTWILADMEHGEHLPHLALGPEDLGATAAGCSITKRTLHNGPRRGVEIVEVHNGKLRFVVVPTRGMGIWRANLGETQLGWKSPVHGPVHPSLVRLWEPSGIGWLDGFDEMFVRCGLESNGAPEFNANGTLLWPLHGRIANTPAHRFDVSYDSATGEIAVSGTVDEARLFGNKLRMETTIRTTVGEASLTVTDVVSNLSACNSELEFLYHINFGHPLLAPGARLHVPVAKVAPRDSTAAGNLSEWDVYGPETPGAPEAVFFMDLHADAGGRTQATLAAADGAQGVTLRFNKRQLPFFTLWKNRMAVPDGYVTGLEPGINFPNQRSFEKAQGRVAVLPPGDSRTFEIELIAHADAASLRAAIRSVETLRAGRGPQILNQPDPAWSA